jgi:hypothetical protein
MLVAWILKRVGGRILRLSISLRNPIRVTPTRYLRVWYVRGFRFSLRFFFFAFSSSADETSFMPCLKSRLFFFSALEYRAGGTEEPFWPIIIFIAITTISHLLLPASYHRPITAATSYGSFPFQTKNSYINYLKSSVPSPISSPSPFFPLQL